jgi:hypothetical protein
MSEILKFDDFSINEELKFPPKRKKSNLNQIEYVNGGVKYKNEMFPGLNIPKRYVGKGKHKYRVLAREGDRVKPINFGDKLKKGEPIPSKLTKKYWESIPGWK